jgi:HK97 family phage major capsid protein
MNDSYAKTLEAAGLRRSHRAAMDNYDLSGAFRYAMSGRQDVSAGGVAVFIDDEFRANGHQSFTKHSVVIPGAAILPHIGRRTSVQQPYQTTVTGSGAELVENDFKPDLFIDALRDRSIVLSLGAQSVGGLKGDVQIPRMATASSAFWLTTTSTAVGGFTNPNQVTSNPITESEGTFDATPLIMAPALIGSLGKISRQLLLQGGDLVNQVIANDVSTVLGIAIDTAAIAGSGTAGQPTGITNTSGIGTTVGTSFAYATSVAALQAVATAKAIINRRAVGWAATPAVAGLLAQRVKGQSFVWEGNVDTGVINGHRALSSTLVPAATAIVGDWSQLLILSWGDNAQVEIEINPYSLFSSGDVVYRAILSCNIVVRHPLSFNVVGTIT